MVQRFARFSYSLFEISRCWHKLAAEEMAKYDLKGPYAVYILTIQRYEEGVTAAQLCELCCRDKADVSRAVAIMEEKGLVKKEGKQPYRARLVLTQKGQEAAAHVCRRAGLAVELAGKDISDADRAVFYAALESITGNLQALCKEGLPPEKDQGEHYVC